MTVRENTIRAGHGHPLENWDYSSYAESI